MTKALLFDIQRFSIHDGPGIRTTLFFKGCPLRCGWCQNPESHKSVKEIAFYFERCARCFSCRRVCPEEAILEGEKQRIDRQACTACGKCVPVCIYEALRQAGTEWNVPDLLTEVLKDRDYFEDSGGGITLSGGEPTMQSGFLFSFLPQARAQGLSVALETCGLCPWEELEALLPFLDLIYFDLKSLDSERHRKWTGSPNERIISNFEKLAAAFPLLRARVPIIPGFNDDEKNIQETIRFLKRNHQETIHLLRYHNLGEAKLARIDTRLKPLQLAGDAREALRKAKNRFENERFSVIIDE